MVESTERILHERAIPFEADEVRMLIFSVSKFDGVKNGYTKAWREKEWPKIEEDKMRRKRLELKKADMTEEEKKDTLEKYKIEEV